MIQICNYEVECTGCSACFSICPHDAITMKDNEEGFLTPLINNELCTHCKLCIRVCPVNSEPKTKPIIKQDLYAAKAKNEQIREKSSSGGLFSIIAKEVLAVGGGLFMVWNYIVTEKKQDFYV